MQQYVRRMHLLCAILLLTAIAGCKPQPPEWMTDPGQIIYLGYKDTYVSCARCHGDEGQGSPDAPEIRNAIRELSRQEVRRIIIFGKGDGKDRMPGFGEDLTPEEISAVLDFITHWGQADSTTIDSAGNSKFSGH